MYQDEEDRESKQELRMLHKQKKANDELFLRETFLAFVDQGMSFEDAIATAHSALIKIDEVMEKRG